MKKTLLVCFSIMAAVSAQADIMRCDVTKENLKTWQSEYKSNEIQLVEKGTSDLDQEKMGLFRLDDLVLEVGQMINPVQTLNVIKFNKDADTIEAISEEQSSVILRLTRGIFKYKIQCQIKN